MKKNKTAQELKDLIKSLLVDSLTKDYQGIIFSVTYPDNGGSLCINFTRNTRSALHKAKEGLEKRLEGIANVSVPGQQEINCGEPGQKFSPPAFEESPRTILIEPLIGHNMGEVIQKIVNFENFQQKSRLR